MISIIITYYSGINILRTNIQLLDKTIDDDTEIIIVNDNPSFVLDEKNLSILTKCPLKIIPMPENKGYAAACNVGAREASGNFLLFLDCDIFVSDLWIQKMKATINNINNCGAVSATILDIQNGNVVHWGIGMSNGSEVIKPYRDGKLPQKILKSTCEFKMLTSGCILIPKRIFREIGGFDEILYNGYCDLDLTYKIFKSGYTCIVCSDAIVYHRGKVAGYNRIYSEEDTRALFISKWKGDLPNDGHTLLTQLYANNIIFLHSSHYMLVNFCRSLFAKEYHSAIFDSLQSKMSVYYEFRSVSKAPIIIEDYLSWSLCSKKEPIIYFVDNITSIVNNYHWFMHRTSIGDIIADRNGNLIEIN